MTGPAVVRRPPAAELLDAALAYAAMGWPVVPLHTPRGRGGCSCGRPDCRSIGKHPRTPHGLRDASTDPDTIREWWTRWPEANIGIVTGAASGIIAVDVDPRHGGDVTWADLLGEHGPIPDTVEAITGGGGRHILFKHPGGRVTGGSGKLGPGIDLKGDGGYIVVEPSLHETGRRYCWEASSRPGEVPLAAPPAWLLERLREDRSRAAGGEEAGPIPQGRRNDTLTRIAGALRRQGLDEAGIRAALEAINGGRCAPPLADAEVARIAASVARYPAGTAAGDDAADDGDGRPPAEIVTLPLSQVRAQAIDWLWSGWIPRGRLTLIAGHPGTGKSYLTQAVAAAVTVGATLPGDTRRDPADVILISLEDDPADTLRPRLEAMAADLDRVHVYRQVIERRTDDDGREHVEERALVLPRDAGLLGDLIRRHDAAMVIIDPLVAVQDGAIDSHRQAAMRQVLAPLHLVARETGAAVVIVAHLRKAATEAAIHRVGGSIDLVAAARTVIVVAPDPEDQAPNPSDRRRVAAVAKSNIGAFPEPLAFTLKDGRFLWDSTPVAAGMTAEALLDTPAAGTEERGALEEAVEFLRGALADGPRPAKEVQREAREAGISEITLRRAKSKLGVRVVKVGMAGGWSWALPEDDHAPLEDDHVFMRDHLQHGMITFGDASPSGLSPEGDAGGEVGDPWLRV